MHRFGATVPLLFWAAAACTSAGQSNDSGVTADEVVRSGNPYAHGFVDADYPRVIEFAPGVYAYEQIHPVGGETITTTSLFVVTQDGVLVADGQESPDETRRLLETIATITDQPVTHVVIASDHGDHTGGNSAFPSDAAFLAHPTSAATLEASANNPSRSVDAPPVVLATVIVGDSILVMGGREIHVLHLGRAHTGGDLVVYVPDGKVLFMSETYVKGIFPPMRSAYPTEWLGMIERAQALDVDVYIPGHGILESPAVLEAELETYRAALERVVAEATRLHGERLDLAEAIEAADFGDLHSWTLSESQLPRAIGRVYMELDGALPR